MHLNVRPGVSDTIIIVTKGLPVELGHVHSLLVWVVLIHHQLGPQYT